MSAAMVPITRSETLAIARGLKASRLAHGLTQKQLGQLVGLTLAQVCKWEKHGAPSVFGRAVRMADALGESLDTVCGRAVAPRPTDAISARERRFLDAARDHVVALYGPDIVERSGGWLTIAEIGWLGYLTGRRDQDMPRSLNSAPYVEEAAAKHRVACHRARERGQPAPRYIPPPVSENARPTEPFVPIEGRIWPKEWYEGWESCRQMAYRLNLPGPLPPTNTELQKMLAAPEVNVAADEGKVVTAREAAASLGVDRSTVLRWLTWGYFPDARKIGSWWSIPRATVEKLAAKRRPRLTAGTEAAV